MPNPPRETRALEQQRCDSGNHDRDQVDAELGECAAELGQSA